MIKKRQNIRGGEEEEEEEEEDEEGETVGCWRGRAWPMGGLPPVNECDWSQLVSPLPTLRVSECPEIYTCTLYTGSYILGFIYWELYTGIYILGVLYWELYTGSYILGVHES